MPHGHDATTLAALQEEAHPLRGGPTDFDPLLDMVGDARYVLLGEATHGSHDFYRVRAEITKRLIRELGFTAVAVEADWPDAYRINRYVRGRGGDLDATEALGGFARFPQWMWRNADVLDFVGWLREFNDERWRYDERVGFYGLDMYSLQRSRRAVVAYLQAVDPDAARRAEQRYACFDHFGEDPRRYGHATAFHLAPSCEQAVVDQLVDLCRLETGPTSGADWLAPDERFFAEQNAKVVVSAERYYREMFRPGPASWNLRDRHMAEVLDALSSFLGAEAPGRGAKVVVWAHNAHVGDARATEMGQQGQLTLGQLVRQEPGTASLLVGFTTAEGTVTAASDWDGDAERKRVRRPLPGSVEALFQACPDGNFFLNLRDGHEAAAVLAAPRLERAIGVIYRPETERLSHYFQARLSQQFDAVLHYDHTRAVEPLERAPAWDGGDRELPETYPSML